MEVDVLISGAVASLIASVVFWGYFWLLQPRIKVSPVIGTEKDVEEGNEYYFIKFLNTCFSALTDVEWELAFAREETIDGDLLPFLQVGRRTRANHRRHPVGSHRRCGDSRCATRSRFR